MYKRIIIASLFGLAVSFIGGCAKPDQSRLSELGHLPVLKQRAKRGDAVAQYILGIHYAKSECCSPDPPRDPKEGAKWLRKAAEQGHVKAQVELAECYFRGNGVPRDATEAIGWYRKAAEQGDASTQYKLGDYLSSRLQGPGIPNDDEESVMWFHKAAEQGNVDAMDALGWCYFEGRGVPEDKAEASKWFQKSGRGEPEVRRVSAGRRSEEQLAEIIPKAEQGNAEAMLELFVHYSAREYRGDGALTGVLNSNDWGPPIDEEAGLQWLRKAAELGLAEAQYWLGNHYNRIYYGKKGIPQNDVNDAEIEKWLRKAAEQGYAMAQCDLGRFYLRGVHDREEPVTYLLRDANISEEDKAEGLKWLRLAIASGKRDSMYMAKEFLQVIGEGIE